MQQQTNRTVLLLCAMIMGGLMMGADSTYSGEPKILQILNVHQSEVLLVIKAGQKDFFQTPLVIEKGNDQINYEKVATIHEMAGCAVVLADWIQKDEILYYRVVAMTAEGLRVVAQEAYRPSEVWDNQIKTPEIRLFSLASDPHHFLE